jgi:prepilin-type N-terminal cleavage/methylation domain-containing protein
MYGASAVNRGIADSCGQRLPEGLWFAPPASTPVFPLAEKGIVAFPDDPVNPVILSKKGTRGFTLVELLVALSIFSILMTALVIIFVGALRTTQTGYQQMDAFERGRSALNVIQDDLVRSYTSHQSADLRSFYGTPIGMTFVGVTQMTSDPKDVNLARITYVVYNQATGEVFPEALEDATAGTYRDAYPYPLLRYVEPGVSDLDSFPINWDSTTVLPPGSTTWVDIGVNFGQLLNDLCGFSSTSADLTRPQQDLVRAKKCEIWIRLLAGGDRRIVNSDKESVDFWRDILGYNETDEGTKSELYKDYIVTENILSVAKPFNRGRLDPCVSGDVFCDRGDDPFGVLGLAGVTSFFDYKASARNSSTNELELVGSPWWNDYRASNWQNPRLPEVVAANFWLMFSSPYPGAPDFQRRFPLEIQLPTGYTRTRNPDLGY